MQCASADIRDLGSALRLLCFARGHNSPVDVGETPLWPDRSIEDVRGNYSDELIDILKRWDQIVADYGESCDVHWNSEEWEGRNWDKNEWPEGWPSPVWLCDTVLPQATARLLQLRAVRNQPAILQATVIDIDTSEATDFLPRVFNNMDDVTDVMESRNVQVQNAEWNVYDCKWVLVPAEEQALEAEALEENPLATPIQEEPWEDQPWEDELDSGAEDELGPRNVFVWPGTVAQAADQVYYVFAANQDGNRAGRQNVDGVNIVYWGPWGWGNNGWEF